ncbi:MAG: FxsA family protein [Acidobacteria bacterium]|nr:FxsA family protein [Acidobacteriota bacterium]
MIGKLLLLFILVPAVELALLIEVGRHIGTLATLSLIACTGALGAFLARRQGLRTLQQVRSEFNAGGLPAGPIVDGVIILLAAALLLTPGILTDALGFLCLAPAFRTVVKKTLWVRLMRAVREGRSSVTVRYKQ